MLFEKNGIRYRVSCRYQADAFRSAGWVEMTGRGSRNAPPASPLEGMSAQQLKAYAAENGIDIGRARSAERISSIIKAALE